MCAYASVDKYELHISIYRYITLCTFITIVVFLISIGNWSVSHPRSGDPVLESTDPSMPNLNVIVQLLCRLGINA